MLKPPAVRFVCLRPWIRCNHLLPKCRALDLAFYLFFLGRVIFAKHGFVHGKLFEQTDTAPGKGNETKTLQILVESCKCQTPPPEIHMPPAPFTGCWCWTSVSSSCLQWPVHGRRWRSCRSSGGWWRRAAAFAASKTGRSCLV